ncbi:Cys-tRNA(Pro)/Cys-tRNA(Cys) deacylase YbaK [Thalassocella blandensis]|nr:Cys-tRNA(Pro)/Cys-tRNA(Cys) deacylase YbaK [Thalassocella blandensis]
MTPAIKLLNQTKIQFQVHEYEHEVSSESYGLEAADKLHVEAARVFKTLVVNLDGKELAVGILPVSHMLSMKLIAKALGAKKAAMADKAVVERTTGYVLGGVSPLGQKKRLQTVIDQSAMQYNTIYISAGRRGLEIELPPEDLKQLLRGTFVDICANI